MSPLAKILRYVLYLLLLLSLGGGLAVGALWWYLAPKLPSIDTLRDVHLQVPLRVYSRDGKLMAEFGEKRRDPLRFEDVPELMVKAVLAAEDDRFYEHPGVDWQGLMRAAWNLIRTGEKGQGGSTITMQVARNFFLGREKTYLRKLNEIILAFKIEHSLGKDEILELYLNKIYLGQRAYGVGAAAKVYYGKPIAELDVAQMAMIAGLPKAPSRFNPVADPARALERRNYVLRRMHEVGFIDRAAYEAYRATPVTASLHGLAIGCEAPYVAEMVRAFMTDRYGNEAYTAGYNVYTTLDSRLQAAADVAIREALLAYDRRHGYRGPERRADLAEDAGVQAWDEALADLTEVAGLAPALVTAVEARAVQAYRRDTGEFRIEWDGLSWARAYINENRRGRAPEAAGDILAAGDVIRVLVDGEGQWQLSQLPEVEGALVSLSPEDGAIVALAGGLDFYRSKFNRATQALRQPGSNFKPFIYSAALEAGFTAASLINDAPVVFDDPGLEATWRPENYSGKFFGPTRLRVALTKSRNLVSIRLLRAVGVKPVIEYVRRFGFDVERMPRNLSLALGSGALTPIEVATGYAVFANGGYRVEPYFVQRIGEPGGEAVFVHEPLRVCRACEQLQDVDLGEVASGQDQMAPVELARRPAPRAISAQNAWLMTSMMRDVVQLGTARRARQLGRKDLAGKTGTTNDQQDAWFSGFNHHLVTTTWVGFDRLRPLGSRETGGRAALPMWIEFMRVALDGVPELPLETPKGLVTVRIDPQTGRLAGADFPDAIFETFRVENVPARGIEAQTVEQGGAPAGGPGVAEQLF